MSSSTDSIPILIKLSESLSFSDKNKSRAYANIALDLSVMENDTTQIATHREIWELVPKIKPVDEELTYQLTQFRAAFGFAYVDAEEYDSASVQFNLAINEVEENNFMDIAFEINRGLSLVYLGWEEYQKALTYFEKEEALTDTIYSLTTKTRIIESSIEEERKQKEKELAQEKIKISELEKTDNPISGAVRLYNKKNRHFSSA